MAQGKRMTREEAKLKGADKKNPQRYRTDIPKHPFELGFAPDEMDKEAQSCWVELSSIALPGVMTQAERWTMEIASDLMSQYRRDRTEFPPAKLTTLIKVLGQLGLNPMDRQRLGIAKSAPAKPKNSGFEDF